jgi:hypothetical protein
LCQTGRFAEAVRVLEDSRRRRDDVELFDAGRWSVYQWWAESLLEQGEVERARDVFAEAQQRYGDHVELQACEHAVWSQYRDEITQLASP